MNPLTLVKRIQNINSKEAALGISEEASWHAKYKDSAYVFVGGIPFDLTEGDLLAVFAQYGDIVDVNLVRDKGTGKSKGFAFIAYEDQRSTNLAVDNLNGAQVLGRIIRVDHVTNYKKKEEEDEATAQQKREARGVCRAFQRGECTRGAGCKFSHDEQRAANTGWGRPEDESSRWGHDKFEGPNRKGDEKNFGNERPFEKHLKQSAGMEEKKARLHGDIDIGSESREISNRRNEKRLGKQEEDHSILKLREDNYKREEKKLKRYEDDEYEAKLKEDGSKREQKRSRGHEDGGFDPSSRRGDDRREEKRSRRHEDDGFEPSSRRDNDRREEKRSKRHKDDEFEPSSRRDDDKREEKRSRRHELEFRDNRDKREGDKWSTHNRDSSSRHHREKDDYRYKSDR